MHRCIWVPKDNQEYINYHDNEWGVPVFDDKKLFEFLILEGAQAGLSWSTILKRRQSYKIAFANWNVNKISEFDEKDIEKLLFNKGIIRNKLKIKSAINNANQFIKIQEVFGSFSKYIWDFVNNISIQNNWKTIDKVPAQTDLSIKISKDLKKRGFSFIGPTIIYAYMQAVGLINDHTTNCCKY